MALKSWWSSKDLIQYFLPFLGLPEVASMSKINPIFREVLKLSSVWKGVLTRCNIDIDIDNLMIIIDLVQKDNLRLMLIKHICKIKSSNESDEVKIELKNEEGNVLHVNTEGFEHLIKAEAQKGSLNCVQKMTTVFRLQPQHPPPLSLNISSDGSMNHHHSHFWDTSGQILSCTLRSCHI